MQTSTRTLSAYRVRSDSPELDRRLQQGHPAPSVPSRRPGTARCRPGARRGASTRDMSWSGLPCRPTLLLSKVAATTDRPANPVSRGQGFGAGPVLGHTVRVASSRDGAHFWDCLAGGRRPAPSRARPVPTSIATDFRRSRACARATHPNAGAGEPQTGKQRRHSCAIGLLPARGSRPGPVWAR
jgi:hypothetical protein